MDCKEFSNLLDACMDGALPDADARRMRDHAAECHACAALLTLRQDCRRMDEEIQVPDSFSSSWRRMIREEAEMEQKPVRKINWKAWAGVAAALVFLIGGTLASRDSMMPRTVWSQNTKNSQSADTSAYGGSAMSYKRSADAGDYGYSAMEMPMMAAGASYDRMAEMAEYEMDDAVEEAMENGAAKTEKIIRSASFTVKTTNYDEDLQRIQDLVSQLGGRVEYLSSSGDASSGQSRSASLTLRVPASRLDEFLNGAQDIGNITSMNQQMEDVSDSYYDVQTRLKTQQEKLARLQAMMAQAEDVSDLIEIESAIADAQYYIDRYTGQLKSYDSKVDYSTVTVSVRETKVTEMKEVTLGERILSGLSDSLEAGLEFLEDMAVFLVSALPWLVLCGVVILFVRVILKKRKNRKEK